MVKDNNIFYKGSHGNFMTKSITDDIDPRRSVMYDVNYKEWQTIFLDSLLRCRDSENVINVNEVIDDVVLRFESVGFLYEDVDYADDEYKNLLDKVSKASGDYRWFNINYLIYRISEYISHLDRMGFIKVHRKDSYQYIDFNIELVDKFFQAYNDNHFVNLQGEFLDDLGIQVENRCKRLSLNPNGKFINSAELYAVIHRLRDLSKYFKTERMSLKSQGEMSSYVFSEWIVYSLQVRQFVKLLFDKLGYSDEFDDMNKVFKYLSLDGRSDYEYMKYIRSLAVIHPDKTDRHSYKDGNGFHDVGVKEHSPYMDSYGPVKDIDPTLDKPKPGGRYKFVNPDMKSYNRKDSFYISIYSSRESDYESNITRIIVISPLEVKQFTENSFNQLSHLKELLVSDNIKSHPKGDDK